MGGMYVTVIRIFGGVGLKYNIKIIASCTVKINIKSPKLLDQVRETI